MSDAAAQAAEDLSPEVAEGEQPAEETPTTDFAAEATEYKKRFAGSQKALNEALAEKKRLAEEAEALRKFKLETERASMTEVQKLQSELEEARREAASARAEAERERLARRFPLSFETLGENAPLSEEALTALEAKLSSLSGEPEQEPRIDPNHPRRQVPVISEEEAQQAALDKADAAFRAMFHDPSGV